MLLGTFTWKFTARLLPNSPKVVILLSGFGPTWHVVACCVNLNVANLCSADSIAYQPSDEIWAAE